MLIQIRQSPCLRSGDTARFRLGLRRVGSIEAPTNAERIHQWKERHKRYVPGVRFPIIVERV